MLGIITGTASLRQWSLIKKMEEAESRTKYGTVTIMLTDAIALICRHGSDPQHHILPHLINHRANIKALQDAGVSEVLGFNSSGSLKRDIKPGAIVIPDDFIALSPSPSIYSDFPMHVTPRLDAAVRNHCLRATRECDIGVMDGGIYWQTSGPRLETKAEIKMMSQFADIVGMTMASEAIIARELDLPYASICSVDNYAHGIGEKDLTMEEISSHARHSSKTIIRILEKYMEMRKVNKL